MSLGSFPRRFVVLAVLGCVAALALAEDPVRLRPLGSIYVDGNGTSLREPEGVGCRGETLAIADTRNGRILTYSIGADTVRPRETLALSQAPIPLRVDFLSDGDLLVLDGRARRIARFGPTGEFRGFVDPRGEGVDSVVPRSFAIGPDDRVFVLDVAGARVVVTNSSGAVERSIAFPPDAGFLSDVTVDGRGDVWVVDSVARRVHASRAGEDALAPITPSLLEDLDFPTGIAVDGEGRLFVVDEHGGGIVILGRDGSFRGRQLAMGWKEGFLRYPADICIHERGFVFVAERGNNRVQMFEIR